MPKFTPPTYGPGRIRTSALRIMSCPKRDSWARSGGDMFPPDDGEFAVPRSSIETYAALIAERRPERILELGISMGGSTALLAELARPTKLVAIDLKPFDEVRARATELIPARAPVGIALRTAKGRRAVRPVPTQMLRGSGSGRC